MKELQKALTQEQKETIYEFVAGWIKSGRKLEDCLFKDTKSINDGDVSYTVTMSTFYPDKLFGVVVNNSKLDIMVSIHAGEIQNKTLVDYIQNYMRSIMSMKNGEMTDIEFNELTNLEVDLCMSRSKKVRLLMERMKDEQ